MNGESYRVTFGGFTVYEGRDEDQAWNAYIGAGPYGRIYTEEAE